MADEKFSPKYILTSWEKLHDNLAKLDEAQLDKLLNYERKNKSRINYLTRIHARLTKIRAKREREELVNRAIKKIREVRASETERGDG